MDAGKAAPRASHALRRIDQSALRAMPLQHRSDRAHSPRVDMALRSPISALAEYRQFRNAASTSDAHESTGLPGGVLFLGERRDPTEGRDSEPPILCHMFAGGHLYSSRSSRSRTMQTMQTMQTDSRTDGRRLLQFRPRFSTLVSSSHPLAACVEIPGLATARNECRQSNEINP